MTKFLKAPDREEFSKLVKLYENEYKGLDRIYLNALEIFKGNVISTFSYYEVESILHLYLLKWGRMGRVLGYRGCKRIGEKLREMEPQFAGFQQLTLSTIDLNHMSKKIEDIYNELLNAKWESQKGRTKRVGPTATSKVFHMVTPDLFMIWDRRIRNRYGFQDSGEEYLRFLANMQNWLKRLSPTIETLQNNYGKSCTKIIDEYNWKRCWADNTKVECL
jgi:hypothetical protein